MIDCAVILAVGNAAHRSQLTQLLPRAMLPAVGKPLVVRVMDRLKRAGIKEYIVIVGVNEGEVAAYLNKTWVPYVKMEFILKSPNDSLKTILANVSNKLNKPFLISAYNSFTHPQFLTTLLNQHKEFEDDLIIAGARSTISYTVQQNFAVTDGQRIRKIVHTVTPDEPHYSLTDVAVCGQHFVEYLKNLKEIDAGSFSQQFIDIARHYTTLEGAKTLIGETAWTLQVESDRDLLTLSKQILDEGLDAHILSELPYTVRILPPVRVDPQVSVGQGAVIGPYVYLERGSTVGREAIVRNTIVLERGMIAAGAKIDNDIVSSRGSIKD